MEEQYRKTQMIQLMIAKEIKRICDKNDIHYFLTGGTMLGAVRHGGFIPWDNDLDIAMIREEYERFLDACATDLDDRFFLQTWDVEEHYAFPFAKLMLKDTLWVEDVNEKVQITKGIYVDIFPHDLIPNDPRKQKKLSFWNSVYRQLLYAKNGYSCGTYKKGIKLFLFQLTRILAFFLSNKSLKQAYARLARDCKEEDSSFYYAFGSPYGIPRAKTRKEWIEDVVPVLFEGFEFLGPRDYHAYLTAAFGDYMTPPPPDKQVDPHVIVKSDLGPYGSCQE